MLTLRQRILIAVSLSIGLVIAIIILIFVLKSKNTPVTPADNVVPVQTNNTPPIIRAPETRPVVVDVPRVPVDPGENYIRQAARSFVERFASYSNQNGNAHIDDVLPLVTNSMAKWVESQRVSASSTYDGITTIVVTSKLTAQTATSATVHVDTQQLKNGQPSYRSGRVEMVRVGSDWKVNGFFWE